MAERLIVHDNDNFTVVDGSTKFTINAGSSLGPPGNPGPVGATGPAGAAGATGATGAAGAAGAKWYTGTALPANNLGVVGDFFLVQSTDKTLNGLTLEKTGTSTWTLRGNLRGPPGFGSNTFQVIRLTGHSYAAGTGSSDLRYRFASRIANALHAREWDQGIALTGLTYSGGYAKLFQDSPSVSRTAPPYPCELGGVGLAITQWGLNDMTRYTDPVPYIHALRAHILRLRTPYWYENDHASVGAGGTNVAKTDRNSGAGTREITSSGTSITISGAPLDSTFPGGEVWLRFVVDPNNVASVAVRVDGGTATNVSLNAAGQINTTDAHPGPIAYKVGNLSAGAHSIQLTFTITTGKAQLDAWGMLPIGTYVPIIVHPAIEKLYDYSLDPGVHGLMSDSLVNTWNTAIQALCDEFTDGFVLMSLEALNKDIKLFEVNGVHPNDWGQERISSAILDVIPDLTTDHESALATGLDTSWRPLSYASGWSNVGTVNIFFVFDTASYRLDSNGFVHFRGAVRKSTAAAPNEIIATLPSGFIPMWYHINPVATDTGIARVRIDGLGGISYYDGPNAPTASTGWLDLSSIGPFIAER